MANRPRPLVKITRPSPSADDCYELRDLDTFGQAKPSPAPTQSAASLDAEIPAFVIPSGPDGSVAVSAHAQYIVRVRKFARSGGPPRGGSTPFVLTVTRPS
jgi:hypothetical protein